MNKANDNFTQSIYALLYSYNDAYIKLNASTFQGYLKYYLNDEIFDFFHNNFESIDLDFYERLFSSPNPFQKYKNNMPHRNQPEYLLVLFMTMYNLNSTLKNPITSLSNWADLQFLFINITDTISSLIMNFDFDEHDTIFFDKIYLPNTTIKDYIAQIINNTEKVELYRNDNRKFYIPPQIQHLLNVLDKSFIDSNFVFIQLQTILLLLSISPIYSKSVNAIARTLLFTFKEILFNTSIDKIIIDNAILSSHISSGAKKTTALKIFFSLDNQDRFCLRLDYPHEGADYLHLNLHEPARDTALPLTATEFHTLKRELDSSDNLQSIFFEFNNLVWFRNDFLNKLKKSSLKISSIEKGKILTFYTNQRHYSLLSTTAKNFSISETNEFLIEFSTACSHVLDNKYIEYSKTSIEDISLELSNIYSKHILRTFTLSYLKLNFHSYYYGIPLTSLPAMHSLKQDVLNFIFTNHSNQVESLGLGVYDDFANLSLEDILELFEEICNEPNNHF